jgi:hypothetical protein
MDGSTTTTTLTPGNAMVLIKYAELAGMTPEQFLYVSVGFEALKKAG